MSLQFVCISIFCIFCLFGRTQLPAVAAVPFEYNEDHEQYPYDLETEQSKAKYDTRLLLSQQLQEEQKSSEESNDDNGDGDHSHDEENEEEKAEHVNDNDDLQPHERAASCYTREHKYTHGQKVPRLDPCEVCLCMDGEIFCWWEKCEKRKPQNVNNNKNAKFTKKSYRSKKLLTKSKTSTMPLSSQFHEESTSEMVEFQPHINKHNNKFENHYITKSLKKQLYQQNIQSQFDQKRKVLQQQQQQQQEHHKHQDQHLQQQQQPQQQKSQKSHMHDKHLSSPTRIVSSSKIMNFPENLPSVLYYDYHTEEHEHHQHQHHQQHLKHQLQKKIQKLQREQERQQKAKQLITDSISLLTTSAVTPPIQAYHNNNGFNRNSPSQSSPSIYAYDDDSQTDSDILPEPPTKKPKIMLTAMSSPATASTKFTISERNSTLSERQESNSDDKDTDRIMRKEWSSNADTGAEVRRLFVGETSATSSIFATDDVIEINKNIKENPRKTFSHQTFNTMDINDNNGNNNEEQDDAFHRWLTSTETYNNNNNNKNNDKYNNDRSKKNNNDSYNDENLPYGNENSYATESSEFENPFGIQNLTMNSQQNIHNNNKNNENKNKNNNNNRSNKLFYPKDQERAQNAENGFLHGVFNNDYSDYNGSVVNIDILLTTQDEMRQQQKQREQQQLNQEQKQQQLHSNHEKQAETEQLPKTPASIMFAAGLILNRGDTKQTAKTINDTKMNAAQMGGLTPDGNTKPNPIQIQIQTKMTTMALTASTTQTPTSYVQFIRHNGTESASESEEGTRTESTLGTTATSSERQCNVMGSLYKIGEVLPQDTGNCLQCICIDGSTNDDTPRVTCSPHNCPPLVLPDLFDATGY